MDEEDKNKEDVLLPNPSDLLHFGSETINDASTV